MHQQEFTNGWRDTERWRSWVSSVLEPMPAKWQCLDLFSGAGGLGSGMEAAGFSTVAFDADEHALGSYLLNMPSTHVVHDTLTPATDWSAWADVPVVVGGPPCQPFSARGKQAGTSDVRNGFPAFLEAVRQVRPEVALAENVRGVLYRNAEYFRAVRSALEGMGYTTHVSLLHAQDYGVPQRRERVVLVGTRGHISWEWPSALVSSPVTAEVALGKDMHGFLPDSRFLTPSMDAYVASYEAASGCKRPRDIRPEVPSRTVTCRNLGSATSDMLRVVLPDGRRRMLSLREGAWLQSFPGSYLFSGPSSAVASQIGNAVPPLMGAALAHAIARCLSQPQGTRP